VTPEERLAETVRAEGARVLATLARTPGSLQLAEDAVQDAAVAALQTWPRSGVPDDPRAWLAVTARNKAYDVLRREAARTKRLVRARQKIAAARIPYRVPSDAELPDRLSAVLAVVHLIGTEAHAPTGGEDVARVDLEAEAVRLARLIAELIPGEPEVLSLLALLLYTTARRPARTGADGQPVLLADQDRSRWDCTAISEASALLSEAVRRSAGVAGPYQLQAHLSACHATAPSWTDTDWDRIIGLYDLLLRIAPNSAVSLNRAVAVGKRDGAAAMLAALDAIVTRVRSNLWHAARADALRQLGRTGEARRELSLALDVTPAGPDRRLLARRLALLSSGPGGG